MHISEFRKSLLKGEFHNIVTFLALFSLLYVGFINYPLAHTVIAFISIYIACGILLIVWKSRSIKNFYFIILGAGYLLIGSIDVLHTFTFSGTRVFSGFNTSLISWFWELGRELQITFFLIAPVFLLFGAERVTKFIKEIRNSNFLWKFFFLYGIIILACLSFLIFAGNFPGIYVNILESSTYVDTVPDIIFDFLKLISFYFIYKAITQVGYQNPYNIFFKGIKGIEEDILQKMDCLENNCNRIYKMSGITKHLTRNKCFNKSFEEKNSPENYNSFMQNLQGIGFQFDKNCTFVYIHGAVEEITGYTKEDILSGKIDWINIIKPEDRFVIFEKRKKLKSNPDFIVESEYRICRKDGEIKWVREIIQRIPENSENSGKFKVEEFQGLIYDITRRKMSEEALEKIDRIRIREVHHRIKNNLQVVSSLLSLQAEQFEDEKVIEAFKESQKRIESIAMIHEELHEGEGTDSLDFADYLRKLVTDLSNSYRVDNDNINFKLELEQANLSMGIAIPLGIVVNELISNSLKYAFPAKTEGEICINFCKIEAFSSKFEIPEPGQDCLSRNNHRYILRLKDNGKGIPEEIDFRNPSTLGLQLINVLVEQIGGHIKLKREDGTEFTILFNN